jgi:hypothetical protein
MESALPVDPGRSNSVTLLRTELISGSATPVGQEIELSLYSPDAEQVHRETIKLSRFGTFLRARHEQAAS